MKKTKILYVITKSVWGGAQRYVFDLAANLPKDQFETVVAAGGSGSLFEKLQKTGIRTVWIPGLQRNINIVKEFISLWHLFKIFEKEKPDIIHLNSTKTGTLGALAAFIYANLQPTTYNLQPKVIFTVHGWGFHEERAWWQKAVIFFISWLGAKFQHRLIHVSKHDHDATLRYRIAPPHKIKIIPLGITRQSHCLSRADSRAFFQKKHDIQSDAFWIGTVAELTKNKGLLHLLDAVNQVKLQATSYKLQAIITGEGEEREKLQNQIHELGLEDTVHLVGFIPDAGLYMKAFDVFMLPSLKEGLPYTMIEAMSAEVPVVATNVGGIPDCIEHQKNGLLVTPADPPALARAITELLRDPKKREMFAMEGAKKIRARFSLSEMLQKHIGVYLDSES